MRSVLSASLSSIPLILFTLCSVINLIESFTPDHNFPVYQSEDKKSVIVVSMSSSSSSPEQQQQPGQQEEPRHPFCDLPGDPSIILTTNVDLGDKKMEIMKKISKSIADHTGKPESYIAVAITDKADVIFGGSDEPTALACVYSIGAIAKESNGKITSDVSDLLVGVEDNRIYINFFDMPRANVGWSKRTFAG